MYEYRVNELWCCYCLKHVLHTVCCECLTDEQAEEFVKEIGRVL